MILEIIEALLILFICIVFLVANIYDFIFYFFRVNYFKLTDSKNIKKLGLAALKLFLIVFNFIEICLDITLICSWL